MWRVPSLSVLACLLYTSKTVNGVRFERRQESSLYTLIKSKFSFVEDKEQEGKTEHNGVGEKLGRFICTWHG